MFSRPMLFLGVLAAAIGVPYLMLNERLAETAKGQLNRLWGESKAKVENQLADVRLVGAAHNEPALPPPAIEEAFRFDVTPQWVTSRWSRISTVAGDLDQLGMRVALVSGTRPDDIAGSLTYYFDKHHQLQRITFAGRTSDPRRLLAATVTPNNLQSQPTTAAAHYILGDAKKPISEVTVRHLPVITSDPAAARAEVSVDLRATAVQDPKKSSFAGPDPTPLPNYYRRW
jgi:hypothetical protein